MTDKISGATHHDMASASYGGAPGSAAGPAPPPPYQPYPQPYPQPAQSTVIGGPAHVVVQVPGAGYRPMQPGSVVAAVVHLPSTIGPGPTPLTCPSCRAQIITRVESRPATRTHIIALVLCLVGLWPCACIPYCMDSCQNAEHYCPNCNCYLGAYLN